MKLVWVRNALLPVLQSDPICQEARCSCTTFPTVTAALNGRMSCFEFSVRGQDCCRGHRPLEGSWVPQNEVDTLFTLHYNMATSTLVIYKAVWQKVGKLMSLLRSCTLNRIFTMWVFVHCPSVDLLCRCWIYTVHTDWIWMDDVCGQVYTLYVFLFRLFGVHSHRRRKLHDFIGMELESELANLLPDR